MPEAFTIDATGIDEIARRLGKLYRDVTISKDPMFGWVQIVNDVTILSEEVRRGRNRDGAERAAKILFRLLEFLGYYLHEHKPSDAKAFSDQLAADLNLKSYEKWYGDGPAEGPTRWILAKYPEVCSKCGQSPCHCLLQPWVFEERRDNPGPYVDKFRSSAEAARAELKTKKQDTDLTLKEMMSMFQRIYRNAHYSQEPWKVSMHLSEELGEATTELSRLELAWLGTRGNFDMRGELENVFAQAEGKINKELKRLKQANATDETIQNRKKDLESELFSERAAFGRGDEWQVFRARVSEKFKEETADVFSWLSAILIKLDPKLEALEYQRSRYAHTSGDIELLICPWCQKQKCSNGCLVSHGVSREIIERITKF